MMKAIGCSAAFFSLVASVALAGFLEIDVSNTSAIAVSLFQRAYLTEPTPNFIACPGCYLLINSPTFSVAAQFGPTFSAGTHFVP